MKMDFARPAGEAKPLRDLPLSAAPQRERMNDPSRTDWCASVRWIRAVDRDKAVLKSRARLGTLNQIKKPELVAELLKQFGVTTDEL